MWKFPVFFVALTVIVGGFRQSDGSVDRDWELWKRNYNKTYTATEESLRNEIWLGHYKVYRQHSQKADRQYDMEMNEFADQVLPRRHVDLSGSNLVIYHDDRRLLFLPPEWDWRDQGVVTPVSRNQGQNSDLALVAAESVESYTAIKSGKLVSLSVAETMQCCVRDPVMSVHVFSCIHDIGGLCLEDSYPRNASTCNNGSCTPVGMIAGGSQVPPRKEAVLQAAVYLRPVMVVVDAGHRSFQLYKSGVYTERECSETRLDHAMLIVGYGYLNGQDYWICKNNWGTSWGMEGYILMARNKGNMCGIASAAFYPV